jgi:hypothetical protein
MKSISLASVAMATALLVACSEKPADTTAAPSAAPASAATPAADEPAPAAAAPVAVVDSLALDATDPRVAHQPEAAALKDGRLHATGGAGVLAFGPYAAVAKGTYTATFVGKIDKVPEGEAVRFDAVSGAGTVPHGSADVKSAAAEGTIAEFPVTLDADVENLELRVQVPAGTEMELASYKLEKR